MWHRYIWHKYIWHKCIWHKQMWHRYIWHKYVWHRYTSHKYLRVKYISLKYIWFKYINENVKGHLIKGSGNPILSDHKEGPLRKWHFLLDNLVTLHWRSGGFYCHHQNTKKALASLWPRGLDWKMKSYDLVVSFCHRQTERQTERQTDSRQLLLWYNSWVIIVILLAIIIIAIVIVIIMIIPAIWSTWM